uniref:Uncharacterized protein n=1 Tax=Plectus sambesii TaxID=2011161 RepID=A0A914X1F4_9BILA
MKSKEKTSILHEWADTTTAHGFHDFFKAKSVVAKLIWFFLITVSLTLMTYQLFRLISEYNRKLWSTTIEEISADSLPLPSLVVCNVNRIKKSRAEQYGLTDDLLHYIFMHMDTQYQVKSYDLSAEAAFIEWRTAYNFSYMDIFDKLAHSFQDIFISSGIIDKVFVKQPIDTLDYGRCQCYDANRSSTVVGTKGGLTLVLDTQGYEYLPLFYDNHLYEGVAVKMAYNCRVEVGQWIILQPATRVSLGMQLYEKTLRESERSPYNPFSYLASEPPCERDPKLMFSDNALGRYTVENCMKECEWLRAVRQCNCIPYMKNEQYRTCEVDELRKCQGDNVSLQFFDQYNGRQVLFFKFHLSLCLPIYYQ